MATKPWSRRARCERNRARCREWHIVLHDIRSGRRDPRAECTDPWRDHGDQESARCSIYRENGSSKVASNEWLPQVAPLPCRFARENKVSFVSQRDDRVVGGSAQSWIKRASRRACQGKDNSSENPVGRNENRKARIDLFQDNTGEKCKSHAEPRSKNGK